MKTKCLRVLNRVILLTSFGLTGLMQGCVVTSVELVSSSTDGVFGNRDSRNPSISLDGNYVAFRSKATNLVQGHTLSPNFLQCYVHDVRNKTTEIVSISTNGVVADNDCVDPKISADGRYVVFASDSDKLDPNAVGMVVVNTSMIYLRDRVAGITRVISLPETIPFVENLEPVLVPDGRAVYYYNFRTRSNTGDPDFGRRLYHYHRSTGHTETFKAGTPSAIEAKHPTATRFGGWVAFETKEALPFTHRDGSVFPVTPDATTTKVYLYHQPSDKLYLASNLFTVCYINGCGYQRYWRNPNGESVNPSISPASAIVAFETTSSNFIAQTAIPGSGDRNGVRDIYLYNRDRWVVDSQDEIYGTPYIRRVSISSEGNEGDGDSRDPSLGRNHVAFSSTATNLVSNDDNGKSDIFSHNIWNGGTKRISVYLTYDALSSGSITPSISENGKRIAFTVAGGHTFDPLDDRRFGGHTPNGQVYVSRKIIWFFRIFTDLFATK